MAPNRITRGGVVRRGLLLAAAVIAAAALLAACGEGGDVATAPPDKQGDARVLNEVLGRQEAAVAAYDRAMRSLGGPELALARGFRAQEQEHVDAVVKAMRGLGIDAEPVAEEIDAAGRKSEADYLEFLYEVESATIDLELSAISKLSASWVRPLLGTILANQAQHLVLLRRALGAKGLETVPGAFEDGTAPPPEPPPSPKQGRQPSKAVAKPPAGKE